MRAMQVPMRPNPTIPRDLPARSEPRVCSVGQAQHSPDSIARWMRRERLCSDNRRWNAPSATVSSPYLCHLSLVNALTGVALWNVRDCHTVVPRGFKVNGVNAHTVLHHSPKGTAAALENCPCDGRVAMQQHRGAPACLNNLCLGRADLRKLDHLVPSRLESCH
eukprot:Hpha_TRINITY_DN19197_c0_g1::TRINITY_DN19197_c0_g1_i1::g.94718::m.94718